MTKISAALSRSNTGWGFATDELIRVIAARAQRRLGHNWGGAIDLHRNAAEKIQKALPHARSIDTYLDSQQADEAVVSLGKLAIAQTILQAERASHLYVAREVSAGSAQQKKLAGSWYPPLARILTAGFRPDNIEEIFTNVSFIVFNYDRCLEVFLYRMVKEYFDATGDEAWKALRNATIIHAYGQVGAMSWQTSGNGQPPSTPLGGGDSPDLDGIAESIKTYSEAADSVVQDQISRLTAEAETIVFMGFGFIAQNMKLLRPSGIPKVSKILATAYGLSAQDKDAISGRLLKIFGTPMRTTRLQELGGLEARYGLTLEDGTCRKLMDNNIFSLADQ